MKGWTPQVIEKESSLASVPQVKRTAPHPTKATGTPREGRQSQEITFNGWLPGNNGPDGLLRMFWVKRAQLRDRLEWLVKAAGLKPMAGPVRLELIRYSTGRPMDYDGLVSTGKLPIDALVRAWVLPDDNPKIIAERSYTQERATSKDQQRTVIRLIPL